MFWNCALHHKNAVKPDLNDRNLELEQMKCEEHGRSGKEIQEQTSK